ncbi:hypothetical protein [Vibrio owensii]|uniref:hypothetical protein n=1 Tax=Vibrio owensii TaxID=696485 RepID=UPI0022DD8694|nr:hypothetical protein [Vibrio owensii]MDA0384203.1 hypothetical protein [Vibrio owensii]
MEKCPAIVGVVFDDKSLAAIDRINELHELEKSAQFFISLGNLINIFGGNVVKGAGSSGVTKAISAIQQAILYIKHEMLVSQSVEVFLLMQDKLRGI